MFIDWVTKSLSMYLFVTLVKKLKTEWIISMTKLFYFLQLFSPSQDQLNLTESVYWFTWQGFGNRGAAGLASVRRLQGLPCVSQLQDRPSAGQS